MEEITYFPEICCEPGLYFLRSHHLERLFTGHTLGAVGKQMNGQMQDLKIV